MNKKEKYKWTFLISIISGIIGIIIVYSLFTDQILESFATVTGVWELLIVTLVRIGIITSMALVMIRKWFKQEEQYLSDIPFLFGVFFLILVYAKLLDMLYGFTFFTATPETALNIIKSRYLLAIANLLPMIYLSVGMLLYYLSLKEKYELYSDSAKLNNAREKILIVIIIIEALGIILAPNYSTIVIILPLMVIPSLITVVWLFAFAYKHQRLSQVHPLILSIGFFIYLTSTISRPILQKSLDIATYAILSETIEILIFIIIFVGLLLKVNYKTEL